MGKIENSVFMERNKPRHIKRFSRSLSKTVLLAAALLSLAALFSCENTSSPPAFIPQQTTKKASKKKNSSDPSKDSGQAKESVKYVTFRGRVGKSSALPAAYAKALAVLDGVDGGAASGDTAEVESGPTKSARPDVTVDGVTLEHFATATPVGGGDPIEGTFESATSTSFEIPLPIGKTWKILCGVRVKDGGKVVLADKYEQDVTVSNSVILHDFFLTPYAESSGGETAKGSVALSVSFSGGAASVSANWEDGAGLPPLTVESATASPATIKASNVPVGNHKIAISFKDANGISIYESVQVVSVLNGLKTDSWVAESGDSAISPSGGTAAFVVNDAVIQGSVGERIYVGKPAALSSNDSVVASDANSGSAYSPLEHLQAAFDKIQSAGSAAKNFKILVSGEIGGNAILSSAVTVAAKAASITIQGLSGNDSDSLKGDGSGSVLAISSNVPVTVKNIKITGGHAGAGAKGGGICAGKGSKLTIESGALITGNSADERGGGVSTAGTFAMTGGEISGNTAKQFGGGIFVESEDSNSIEANISGSAVISGNSVSGPSYGFGGGLYVGTRATVKMSGGQIKENEALRGGGGVRISGTSAKFELSENGKIADNSAEQGGGIDDDAAFEMSGGVISGNTAERGGAIVLSGSYSGESYALASFKIGGTASIPCSGGEGNNDVYANRARKDSDDDGKYPLVQVLSGGFSLPSGTKAATLTPQDWQRGLDILEASSGDIDSYKGYFALTDGDFDFSKKSGSATIAKLKAPLYIKANGSDSPTASGTKSAPYKTLNYAVTKLSGGEPDTILVIGKVSEQKIPGLSTDKCSALTIKGVVDDSDPSSPVAPEINASGGNTSALVLNAAAPITIQNLKITGGQGSTEGSYSYGGGIKLTAGTLCLADGALVTGNKASYGGGVYISKGASLYMYGTALVGDSADTPATGTEPNETWSNCANYASSDGGGIYNKGSVYLGYSGTVSGSLVPASLTGGVKRNLSNSSSGGISLYGTASGDRAVLKMRSGYVSYNKACEAGGGIKAFQSDVEISEGGEISCNQGKTGGGIAVASYTDVNLIGGTVKENSATTEESYEGGGAVSVMAENTANFTMAGSVSIPYGGAKNNNDVLLTCVTDNTGNIVRQAFVKVAGSFTASGTAATITFGKWKRGLQFLGVGGDLSALPDGVMGKFDFTQAGWDKALYKKSADNDAAKIDSDIYVAGSSPAKCKKSDGTAYTPTDTNTIGNWAHPFASISGALSSGLLDSSHQAIVVDGTVTGAQQQVPSSFTTALPDGLTIKGYKASSTAASAAAIKRYANPSTATAATNGSALKIDNATVPVSIEDLTITGGKTSGNGGGINIVKGTVKLGDGAKVTGNSASSGLGGGVYVSADGKLFMYGKSYVGDSTASTASSSTNCANTAKAGGGIYNYGSVYIGYSDDSTKKDMTAGYGVCRNYASGASDTAGGIINRGTGILKIASGSISYNQSAYHGGGIYGLSNVTIEAPVTATNKLVMYGNKAKVGGAIYVGTGCALAMEAGQIGGSEDGQQNIATEKGGAIFQGESFSVSGTALIYPGSVKTTPTAEMTNDVYLPKKNNEGKIFVVTAGASMGNSASQKMSLTPEEYKRGTKIILGGGSDVTVDANLWTKFALTTDDTGWNKEKKTVGEGTDAKDYVAINSPIYVVGASGTGSSKPDTTWGWGKASGGNGTKSSPYASIAAALGCADLAEVKTITIAGTLAGAQQEISSPSVDVTLTGYKAAGEDTSAAKILRWSSKKTSQQSNGSVLNVDADGKTVTITDLTLSYGYNGYGGGIYITKGTVKLGDYAKICDNQAGNSGGGVYVSDGATLFMYGKALIGDKLSTDTGVATATSTDYGNYAQYQGGGGIYNGGAVYIGYSGFDTDGTTLIESSIDNGYGVIRGWTMNEGGGAIRNNGTLKIKSGSFAYNKSSTAGGAIVCASNATISGGLFVGNEASGGGAISVSGSKTLTVDGPAVFKNNNATGSGGAISISNNGTLTMSAGTIGESGALNTAATNGGAIYQGGTFNISGSAYVYPGSEKSNDVYLASGKSVSVNGSWSGSQASTSKMTLTPANWTRGTTVVSKGSSSSAVNITTDILDKFSVPDSEWSAVLYGSGTSAVGKIDADIYVAGSTAQTVASVSYGAGKTIADGGRGTKALPYSTVSEAVAQCWGGPKDKGTNVSRTINIVGTISGAQEIASTVTTSKASGITLKGVNTSATLDGGFSSTTTDKKSTLTLSTAVPVTIQSLKITGGYAAGSTDALKQGGGINITAGTVTLSTNALVYSNYASKGAGVYVASGARLNVSTDSTKIYSNTGSSGGGIYNAGTLDMTAGKIYSNSVGTEASYSGGGVYSTGTFYMSGTANIYSNTASIGGGVYNSGTFTMGASVASATAGLSGAIYKNQALPEDGSEGGGGVCNTGTFTMKAGTIGGSSSTDKNTVVADYSGTGGGVWNTGTFTMSGGKISYNEASEDYLEGGSTSPGGCGAGVASTGTNNSFTLDGGTIDHNTAKGNGGGIYISHKPFTFKSGTISNNSGRNGGGVFCNNAMTMSGGTISGNSSTTTGTSERDFGGGGVYCYVSMVMSAGTISGNKAAKNGGGVFMEGMLYMSETAVIGNSGASGYATSESACSNYAAGDGGGVYLVYDSGIVLGANAYPWSSNKKELTGGIYYNYASGSGGGIYNYSNDGMYLYTGNVCKNGAGVNGGGVCSHMKDFEMSGGTVDGNYALNGGGIYFVGNTIDSTYFYPNLSGGTISNNIAEYKTGSSEYGGYGGGIYIGEKNGLRMTGGTISSNTAKDATESNLAGGGGVYIAENGSIFMSKKALIGDTGTSTSTYSNEAVNSLGGGGIFSVKGKVYIGYKSETETEAFDSGTYGVCHNKTATGAAYGGAIYASGGVLKIASGYIQNNTGSMGGAIYINKVPTCSISGGTFQDNKATKHGGALYVNKTVLEISNASFLSNSATNGSDDGKGGALFIPYTSSNTSEVTIKSGTIFNSNTALKDGGAIYNQCPLTLDGGEFGKVSRYNEVTASDGTGGAIYTSEKMALGGAIIHYCSGSKRNDVYLFGNSGSIEPKSSIGNTAGNRCQITRTWATGKKVLEGSYISTHLAKFSLSNSSYKIGTSGLLEEN